MREEGTEEGEALGKLSAGSDGLCEDIDVVEGFGFVDAVGFVLEEIGGVELGDEGL